MSVPAYPPVGSAHPESQWKGPGRTSTDNGPLGCTQAELVQAIRLWTGKVVTADDISQAVGFDPKFGIGMSGTQVKSAIAHWKLPYVASYDMPKRPTTRELLQIVRNTGPVLLAIPYYAYPLAAGIGGHSRYGTARYGGKDDLSFNGNHFVTLFASRYVANTYRQRLSDPDHGSGARPTVPPFDVISYAQFDALYNAALSGKPYPAIAYVPTREWTGVPK